MPSRIDEGLIGGRTWLLGMEGQEQAPATPIGVAPARELLSFAASRPGWQQHLIRCLYVDGEATPQNLEDAYQMLLADHGAADAEPLRPKPLMASDVPPRAGPATTPVLHTLGPLSGINRLVDDQVLPFATDGLTVIYGENATGKSGYVRVLKKLCRAHATSENILPDVSGAGEEQVAQGHIRFSVDGQVTEVTWRQGDDPPDQLATVSVFDSRRAPLYSDGERRLEFLPAGLDVLGKLGELLLGLAGRCDAEIAALRRTLPTLNLQVPTTT